jgi:hypothetical protein
MGIYLKSASRRLNKTICVLILNDEHNFRLVLRGAQFRTLRSPKPHLGDHCVISQVVEER